MKVVADNVRQVGANLFRLELHGDVDVVTAKEVFFPDGVFKGKKIAQGSAYINDNTFDVDLYTEDDNKWGGK